MKQLILSLCVALASYSASAEWQRLEAAKLVASPSNDGDSFRVAVGDRTYILRLYFVDCPETEPHTDADVRRIQEQTRYFGLADNLQTLHFGREATAFVEQVLAQPFTVHTTSARAPGRSAEGRIFAFVETADGRDLGEALVRQGLARAFGVGRGGPDGRPRDELAARMADLEQSAMLRRAGIWAATDPDRLVTARGEQRQADREIDDLRAQMQALVLPVDINSAPTQVLRLLPGIGPVLAERIVQNRPFAAIEDLTRVEGIGPVTFDALRELVVCEP